MTYWISTQLSTLYFWQGLKSGPGVYEYADGELDVSFYEEDIRVGEGVRWSASRHQASLLVDGQLVGEEGDMPIDEATKRTKELGFVVWFSCIMQNVEMTLFAMHLAACNHQGSVMLMLDS